MAILVVVYEVRVVPTGTIYVALIVSLNDVTIAVTVDMVPFYSECLPSSCSGQYNYHLRVRPAAELTVPKGSVVGSYTRYDTVVNGL